MTIVINIDDIVDYGRKGIPVLTKRRISAKYYEEGKKELRQQMIVQRVDLKEDKETATIKAISTMLRDAWKELEYDVQA